MNASDIISSVSAKLGSLNEKNRYYVLGGVLLLIFLLDYFIIMMPQIKTLVALNPKIATLSKDLKQARLDIKSINQYQTQVAQLREKMKMVGSSILSREEIPTILENISVLANASKVKINQIMPMKESQQLVLTDNDGTYYSLPILVNARGSYHNIGRFLNRVETNGIAMSVVDFDMTATNDDPYRHALNLTIKTFVRDRSRQE